MVPADMTHPAPPTSDPHVALTFRPGLTRDRGRFHLREVGAAFTFVPLHSPSSPPSPPSRFPNNVARNSPACISRFEIASLELQRFQTLLKLNPIELRAKFAVWSLSSVIELVAQGHCTTWVGIALLSCQCNAVLSGALVPYLVHCFVAMKPVTPLRAWWVLV